MIKLYEEFSKEEPKVEIEYWDNGQKRFELWLLNGKQHREDGPSYQVWYYNGQKLSEWWSLNDKFYSREEWVNELKKIGSPYYEEQKMLLDIKKYNL